MARPFMPHQESSPDDEATSPLLSSPVQVENYSEEAARLVGPPGGETGAGRASGGASSAIRMLRRLSEGERGERAHAEDDGGTGQGLRRKGCLHKLRVYKGCLILIVSIIMILFGIVCLLIPFHHYFYPPGTETCTDYDALSTDVILCGEGDSCSYHGIYTSVPDGYTTNKPISAKLVHNDDLIFYKRQRNPVYDDGPLIHNVLFDSDLEKVYAMTGSVFSGFCCVGNQNSVTETATLELYRDFDDAIMASGKNTLFSEAISIPAKTEMCFNDWGLDSPFTIHINSYAFFLLSASSSNMNYTFNMSLLQVYINASDYSVSKTHYFTGKNRSHFSYDNCFRHSKFTPIDYIVLCQASSEDVEGDYLRIHSCPDTSNWHRSSTYICMALGIFSVVVGSVLIVACIVWKIRKRAPHPIQESPD